MAKTYRITLTEEQMRVTEHALEFYMRTMLGQGYDIAEDLGFYGFNYESHTEDEFYKRIVIRDAIRNVIDAVFKIAYGAFGTPKEKTESLMEVECIWDAIRFARGVSRWGQPFQIGDEPSPKIEVTE